MSDVDQEALAAEWEAASTAEQPDFDGAGSDALASEWEAMVGADGESFLPQQGAQGPERILNQDEIDSLLGFSVSDEDGAERSGIRAIINSALVSYERLPMLEIVFDRLVRLMTTSLRNFTSDNVEVSLDNISSIRFGDYLNSIPLPAILSVFRAQQLDNYGLLTVDSNLIYSVVDVLLGGRRGTSAMRIEGRPYTTIERTLVQRMIEVVLADAKQAFAPLTEVDFTLDRVETNPRFAAIRAPGQCGHSGQAAHRHGGPGRRSSSFFFRMRTRTRSANASPFGHRFGGAISGEAFGDRAVVHELKVLSRLCCGIWRFFFSVCGRHDMLDAGPDSPVELRCGTIPLTRGRMGRLNHNVAVRLDAPLTPAARRTLTRFS